METLNNIYRFVTGQNSAAEDQVNAIYGSQPDSPITTSDDYSLGWWDSLKESIMPESHGESVVNAIYGPAGTRGISPDPAYNVEDLSSPNVYVQAKGAVKDTVTAFSSLLRNNVLLLAAVLLVVVVVYAAVPALIRR